MPLVSVMLFSTIGARMRPYSCAPRHIPREVTEMLLVFAALRKQDEMISILFEFGCRRISDDSLITRRATQNAFHQQKSDSSKCEAVHTQCGNSALFNNC